MDINDVDCVHSVLGVPSLEFGYYIPDQEQYMSGHEAMMRMPWAHT